jgi:hypothetical protein
LIHWKLIVLSLVAGMHAMVFSWGKSLGSRNNEIEVVILSAKKIRIVRNSTSKRGL